MSGVFLNDESSGAVNVATPGKQRQARVHLAVVAALRMEAALLRGYGASIMRLASILGAVSCILLRIGIVWKGIR
jgi:hypothetical protein